MLIAHPGALASQWIPADPTLWKVENFRQFLEARKSLLAAEVNQRMEDLLSPLFMEQIAASLSTCQSTGMTPTEVCLQPRSFLCANAIGSIQPRCGMFTMNGLSRFASAASGYFLCGTQTYVVGVRQQRRLEARFEHRSNVQVANKFSRRKEYRAIPPRGQ
jgi:hypothetical protein